MRHIFICILLLSLTACAGGNRKLSDLSQDVAAAGVGLTSWAAQSEAITGSDLVGITDVSDTTQSDNGSSRKATMTQVGTFMATLFEPIKGTDDNYVTDAEKTNIGNLASAAYRSAEDTLTNGSNLPDGEAIITYGNANWGVGGGMIYPEAGIPLSTGSAWGTSYTLSALTLALPPADILTVLSDQDLVVNSFSTPPATIPADTFLSSASGDADKTVGSIKVEVESGSAGSVTSSMIMSYKDGNDASGSVTDFIKMDGTDNTLKITPVVQAAVEIPISRVSANYAIGTNSPNGLDECYGGVVYVDAASVTVSACADIAVGMSFEVVGTTANAFTLDPQATDRLLVDGTALADGVSKASTGAAYDRIICVAESSAGWDCQSATVAGGRF